MRGLTIGTKNFGEGHVVLDDGGGCRDRERIEFRQSLGLQALCM